MGKVYIIITFLCKQQLSSDVTFTRKHWELLNDFADNKPLQSIHMCCWIIQSSQSVPALLGWHKLKFILLKQVVRLTLFAFLLSRIKDFIYTQRQKTGKRLGYSWRLTCLYLNSSHPLLFTGEEALTVGQ